MAINVKENVMKVYKLDDEIFEDAKDVLESAAALLDEMGEGESLEIEVKEMTKAELEALPDK